MALEWCILGPTGTPEISVAMQPEAHAALIASVGDAGLLKRTADYYQDAEYAPWEVAGLLVELASSDPLTGIAELAALCEVALRRGCGIVVLAD